MSISVGFCITHVTLVEIPDAGHFALNQKPGEIAKLVLEAMGATAEHRSRSEGL